MEYESDFYLTLPSNASTYLYPDNSVNDFRTQLPHEIRLKGKKWEAALAEFTYPLNSLTIRDGGAENNNLFIVKTFVHEGEPTESEQFKITAGVYETIESIIAQIDSRLEKTVQAKNITLRYDPQRRRVKYTIPKGLWLIFYGDLATALGFEPYLKVGSTAIGDKNEGRYAPKFASVFNGRDLIYIYSDVIEAHVVGNSLVPLLRTVSPEGESKRDTRTKEFLIQRYYPVRTSKFSEISIKITDQLGKLFPFETDGRSIIVLHFRKRLF